MASTAHPDLNLAAVPPHAAGCRETAAPTVEATTTRTEQTVGAHGCCVWSSLLAQTDPPGPTARPELLHRLREWARLLKRDTYALYLAARHPRTPWYAKVLAGAVVAYALSPFDLIPDFIPVIGYLDDLIIVPLGIAAVVRLIPAEVLEDCRAQAEARMERRVSWVGAAFIVAVWLAVATWLVLLVRNLVT